ncbi:MAG: uracil-DNA glycosylase [Helicobacteraceae bacterium]
MERIDCRKCKFFYVTWQPATPYGCKAYGFKSRLLPSLAVRQNSGANCTLFQVKDL